MLANAKPADFNDQIGDASTSVSDESDDKSSIPDTYPVSVYTKYPDDSDDSYKVPDDDDLPPPEYTETRIRRQTGCNENDASIDISKQADHTDDTKRPERKTEDYPKVPLRGLISAIESDLVSRALDVNSKLRRRRSTERIVYDDNYEDSKETQSNNSNNTAVVDSVDVNKDFFGSIFNYTRPLRETEEKDVKIPLNGLVNAIETTLVNSAQNLKDLKHSKREISTNENPEVSTEPNESRRINRDTTSDQEVKKEPEIKVAKIGSTSSIDLNLLSPIAFKTTSTAPVGNTEESTNSGEEGISTTEISIPKTNITVIQSSSTVNLVPGADQKLAHIQHQQISRTVFQSSLAIFPTIPPTSINAPLPHYTTTEEPIETTVPPKTSTSTTSKNEQELKHEQLLQKAQKLKEKFAEIQAEPVILSQF